MKLIFRLRFQTKVGQSLFIIGNHELLGAGRIDRMLPLSYLNLEFWQVTLPMSDQALPDAAITYNYILRNADGSIVQDWGNDHVINPALFQQNELLIIDSWNYAGAIENALYTEPFVFPRRRKQLTLSRSRLRCC
jgi:4-alpha-glucanotransferase